MARKWKDVRDERLSEEQIKRVNARVADDLAEMTLQDIRRARKMTQSELAELLDVSQPELSRLENSNNPLLQTIRRAVEALGGELEVRARFDDGEDVKIIGM